MGGSAHTQALGPGMGRMSLDNMAGQDPYPRQTFSDTLRTLGQRFPNGDVNYHPRDGNVLISLSLKDGGSFRIVLTWQQAKYLAYGQVTGDDLKDERFPPDWPRSGRVSNDGESSASA